MRLACLLRCALIVGLALTGCDKPSEPDRHSTTGPAAPLAAPSSAPTTRTAEPAGTKSAAGLIASPEGDWPQWRGPRRDGICNETGLLGAWPPGGPTKLWQVDKLGQGWSSPIIAGGLLYITGDVGNEVLLYAYRLDGTLAWKSANGPAWRRSYRGARACCLYRAGKLYHMNAHGRVACLDAKTGKEIWAVDVAKQYQAKSPRWGYSECLLVDGQRLIVTPGGARAMMVALDKDTGKEIWASDPIPGDDATYTSPVLFEFGGMRHLVNCSATHAFGVCADTGKLQWTHERRTRYNAMAAPPVYHDGTVFFSSPDSKLESQEGQEGQLLRLTVDGGKARAELAGTSKLNNLSGGVIFLDGLLYGSGYRSTDGWFCVDPKTGKPRYHETRLNTGSVLYADGRLYCLSERGEMALVEPKAEGFAFQGRFKLVAEKKADVWAHPVIHNKRLYLRYHDTLWCYDIAAK